MNLDKMSTFWHILFIKDMDHQMASDSIFLTMTIILHGSMINLIKITMALKWQKNLLNT